MRVFYLAKRAVQLCREHGPRLLIYSIVHKSARVCLSSLNRMSMPRRREGYVVREILGSKMYLDLADDGISHDLIVDGIRESVHVETIMKEVKKGDVVIDIGANIGYYVLLEASLVGNEGKVFAIEPVPSNFELLKKNIQANQCPNVELYQFAVGDIVGRVPMYLSSRRNLGSLLDVNGTSKAPYVTEQVDVELTTLDDFLKNRPYPKALRMDVEGYEYQIINGMKDTLQKNSPLTLFVEFHFHILKSEKSSWILKTLKNAGFEAIDVASEPEMRGRHRRKFLSKLMSLTEPLIEEKLHQRPWGRHLNLSIDDILADPAILDGRWGALYMCFRRK